MMELLAECKNIPNGTFGMCLGVHYVHTLKKRSETVVCEPFPEKAWVAVFFQEEGVHVVGCFVKRVPETKKRLKSRLLFTDFLGGIICCSAS
jgi:hypothetical protein